MKKLFLSSCLVAGLVSSVAAIDVGDLKISPEVGMSIVGASSNTANNSGVSSFGRTSTYGGYARFWIGVPGGFVVAPQVSLDSIETSAGVGGGGQYINFSEKMLNYQYGLLLGKEFEGVDINTTIYVGFNISAFSKVKFSGSSGVGTQFSSDVKYGPIDAYHLGVRVKLDSIPLAISYQLSYQNPSVFVSNVKVGQASMFAGTILIGLAF